MTRAGAWLPAAIRAATISCCTLSSTLVATATAKDDVAFVHVRVLPMDRERCLDDQTVLVRGETIAACGPAASVAVPPGARVVDGARRACLMPGLCDLHVHTNEPDELLLYVVNGVTTVLHMGHASPNLLSETRKRIERGELIGPAIYAGPLLNGRVGSDMPCSTPDEARATVRAAKARGYEFLKVYNDLPKECFHAICEEAREQEMAVVGHGVRAPGLEESFAAGQIMLAHAEEYLYTILAGVNGLGVNSTRVPLAIEITKRYGIYVCANLSAYEAISMQWGKPEVVESFLARPETRWLPMLRIVQWREGFYTSQPGDLGGRLELLRDLTKKLFDAGVPILLGTDSPDIPGMSAGFSIHDDLRNLVAAGLTPFQALSCGTRVAGEFLAKTVPDAQLVGLVAAGQRADLVLVNDDPLADLARLRDLAGVMVAGRWLPRRELDAALAALAEKNARARATQQSLRESIKSGSAAAAIEGWLAKHSLEETRALLDQAWLNELGYELLRKEKRPADAVAVFELNCRLRPSTANGFDSLGDALAAKGDADAAIRAYARAVELDPGFAEPAAKLRDLRAKPGGR